MPKNHFSKKNPRLGNIPGGDFELMILRCQSQRMRMIQSKGVAIRLKDMAGSMGLYGRFNQL